MTEIPTRTRVVLLQHPRERDMPIGTARMAHLCLPNSELYVGVRWQDSAALAREFADPARPPVLLYPGEGAIDVERHPPAGPVTLVVVDGTWWQTKTLVRDNPRLASLPRYSFAPPAPSEYRIRREPRDEYVSTVEALVHVLGAIEGDGGRFAPLLAPFRAMIDAQIACEERHHGASARVRRRPRPRLDPVPEPLRSGDADVVCVVGEANAWPYDAPERARYGDEIVHWAARRLSTGETFEAVVAPTHPLAPRTTDYVGLDTRRLAAGISTAELLARWRHFSRETDVVCAWGHYAPVLFVASGGYLAPRRFDLRKLAREVTKSKFRSLDDFVASRGSPPATGAVAPRALVRLALLETALDLLREVGAALARRPRRDGYAPAPALPPR